MARIAATPPAGPSTAVANSTYAPVAEPVSLAETTRAQTAEGLKLAKASNLSDLADAPTARTNLGLGTAATHATGDYARIVSGLLPGSGNAVGNLAILNAATASLGTVGGTIIINTPGEYQISDSWNWDAEDCHLHLGAGVHIFTTAATTYGGAVQFIGYLGSGTALTPQRNSALISGSGKVTGWLGGANENAVGAVRVKRVTVLPGLTVEGGNKGITTQYGVDDVDIDGVMIPSAGFRGISIEQQGGAIRARVANIKVGVTGAGAVVVTGDRVMVENISVDTAFATAAPGSSAAVEVYARDSGNLSQARIAHVAVTEANGGKGALISSASNVAKMSNINIGHSVGAGAEFYNCVGLNVAEDVNAPNSASTVASTGTTSAVILRNADPMGAGALALGQSSIPRQLINTTGITMSSGTLRGTYWTASKSELMTTAYALCGTTAAGATPTLVRFAVFSVANNGDLTLVASTTSDTTLLGSANTETSKALTVAYAVVTGRRYASGLLVVTGAAIPTVAGNSVMGGIGSESAKGPKLAFAVFGLSDLPATITNAVAAGSTAAPYIVVKP